MDEELTTLSEKNENASSNVEEENMNTNDISTDENSSPFQDDASSSEEDSGEETEPVDDTYREISEKDLNTITITLNYTPDANCLEVTHSGHNYEHIKLVKTGDTQSIEKAENLGFNAALLINNGASTNLYDAYIISDGYYANDVFLYGENSSATISGSLIESRGDNSNGIRTNEAGSVSLTDVTIHTNGNLSSAIKGGNISIGKCYLKSNGISSPTINVKGIVTINKSYIGSEYSPLIDMDGNHTITITDSDLVLNDLDDSENGAILLYQTNREDDGSADTGTSNFVMNNGSINADVPTLFYITNTDAQITLHNVTDNNSNRDILLDIKTHIDQETGVIEGSNVTLDLDSQTISGGIYIELNCNLEMNLTNNSNYSGYIDYESRESHDNTSQVSITIEEGSVWSLTEDSYVTELNIDSDNCIILNDHNLYVDGQQYIPEVEPGPTPDPDPDPTPDPDPDPEPGPDPEPEPEPEPDPEPGSRYDDMEYFFDEPRILRLCKSSELPAKSDRDPKYIYFVYDKQRLIVYQSVFIDPFCIVTDLPPEGEFKENALYITLSGYVFTYSDYGIRKIGHVEYAADYDPDSSEDSSTDDGQNSNGAVVLGATGEVFDPDQLEILRSFCKLGFMNAEGRYIDNQTRQLQLPFQNGDYQLALSLREDIKINENTVIKFNRETEQWEIYGDYEEQELPDVGDYKGYTTDTVESMVDEHVFRGRVRISNMDGNGLQVFHNGLYINTSNKAEKKDFDQLTEDILSYKAIIDAYILEIREAILKITQGMSKDVIEEEIMKVLEEYEPTIRDMFSKYNDINNRISALEFATTYALDTKIDEIKQQLIDFINTIANPWEEFEHDYYPYYSDMTPEEYKALATVLAIVRKLILELRANTEKDIIILENISGLPSTEDDTKIFYIWNDTNRIYTKYVWDNNTSSYIAGDSTLPYAEPVEAPEQEDETTPTEPITGGNINAANNLAEQGTKSILSASNDTNNESVAETVSSTENGSINSGSEESENNEDDISDDISGDDSSNNYSIDPSTGLTEDELSVLTIIQSNFSSFYYSFRSKYIYESVEDLPELGGYYDYYVINFTNNLRLIYNPNLGLYEEYEILEKGKSKKTGVTVADPANYRTHNRYQIYEWIYPTYDESTDTEGSDDVTPETGHYELKYSLYDTIDD